MDAPKKVPTALKVVAALFVISGVFDAVEILVSLVDSHINFNLGVLGIFIGRGLLRFRSGWRTCALVFTWLALVFGPLFAILAASGDFPTYFELFGQRIGDAPPAIVGLFFIIFFAIAVWQYRVLTRRDVAALFYGPGT